MMNIYHNFFPLFDADYHHVSFSKQVIAQYDETKLAFLYQSTYALRQERIEM